jgi:hypothetical protein
VLGASPHRLVAQDGALSRPKQRFESAWGHWNRKTIWNHCSIRFFYLTYRHIQLHPEALEEVFHAWRDQMADTLGLQDIQAARIIIKRFIIEIELAMMGYLRGIKIYHLWIKDSVAYVRWFLKIPPPRDKTPPAPRTSRRFARSGERWHSPPGTLTFWTRSRFPGIHPACAPSPEPAFSTPPQTRTGLQRLAPGPITPGSPVRPIVHTVGGSG